MQVKELHSVQEMLPFFYMLHEMYPEMIVTQYEEYLNEMITRNYKQLIVLKNNECVALTGFWTGIKLWSGKYIEIDNFIVSNKHRGSGYAKVMTDYLDQKAQQINANMIVLDAFTGNFKAHRFYYNQGYAPRGFHFVKITNEDFKK